MKTKMKGASLDQSLPSVKATEPEEDFETEGHLNDLHRAAKIMSDPAKLQKVHALAGRRHKAVQALIAPHIKDKKPKSLDDLRKIAGKKRDDDEDMGD